MADAATEERINRPDYKIEAYVEMEKDWGLCRDLYAGARRFKESDAKHLKKYERETDEGYEARLDEADLYAVFQQAIKTDVGLVFQNSVAPSNAPPALEELFADIDLCGNDLDAFLRNVFMKADRDGHSFIFVDAPPPLDIERATMADVEGRRPWWVCYEASQVINWRTRTEQGRIILEQVTIEENVVVPKGLYGEESKTYYRVLKNDAGRVSFSVYEIKEAKPVVVPDDAGNPQEDIQIQDFNEIPLYACYGNKKGSMLSTPPRLGLAGTNKKHFNKLSLLDYVLTFVKPFIVFKFNDKSDADKFKFAEMAVSNAVKVWGEHASVEYLELKGTSIPELRTEITGIEERMAKLSFERFAPVRDNSLRTATEVGSDNRREMSELAMMAKNLENCVDSAFDATIRYLQSIRSEKAVQLSDDERADLKLNIEYDKLTFTAEQMDLLMQLEQRGLLSADTVLELLPRFIDMPEGWDPVEEAARRQAVNGVDERILSASQVSALQAAIDGTEQA